ncbi:efflux RND transporter permease subunit [Pseudoteredinibacter isoporae]|uniref:Multidrug efflux pump subunit AcrB n=1 Tax=Pseudoteredinibacter isoporae TaxID=570281 RepID=A0A7X0JQP5_9GAMM|nr:efflux RND transporter permease subunit [Pseudoteredinibacter isoporae]MBB6520524.1 multidrug efflux pump subunit AcrB [Pseudoteredinibacter isoporae]NHO86091.1 efflux RND transporter permease subunit [Pseudoteredinibacter isoporae]NIB25458.1 efflux RND transporter permease subunit [Pseudoteredinibacter isoporae]
MNRLVQWFVENPIAANLLMVAIIIGGVYNYNQLDREVFPGASPETLSVYVPYPGAGPKEVEEQIVKRIEQAVFDLEGIKKIESSARNGSGNVTIEVQNDYDTQALLNEVKTRVDSITTFPADVERPEVRENKQKIEVLSVGIYGEVDDAALKATGEWLRDEISLLPAVTLVDLEAVRPEQMAIEISEQKLRRYGLRFEDVVNAVRGSSMNLGAGSIRSKNGDLQVQTRAQAYTVEDFQNIVIQGKEDGSELTIGDVADVKETLEEWNLIARLNGRKAVYLEVYATDNPNVVETAKEVRKFMDEVQDQLPPGVHAVVWRDWSTLFEGRLNLLMNNSLSGLVLVFVVLMLFLRPALAAWVTLGIAVAFLGALWFLPLTGVSLNMLSLFAFLLVLGIVVDDAIIVGESVYSRQQAGMQGNLSAATGAKMVSKPVLLAVVSTIIFFAPMLFIPGPLGEISFGIPAVVTLCLVFSLVESLLILPSHLAHMKPEKDSRFTFMRRFQKWRQGVASGLEYVADRYYKTSLKRMLQHNGATVAVFIVAFGLSVSVFMGGWVGKSFMPVVASDFVRLRMKIPEGAPFSTMDSIIERVEGAVPELKQDTNLFGEGGGDAVIKDMQTWGWRNNILVSLSLDNSDGKVSADAVVKRWRELVGPLPELEEITLDATINDVGADISLLLTAPGDDEAVLNDVAKKLEEALLSYSGVHDVRNTIESARSDIQLSLKPYAETLGLSLSDVARQVRQGFYGAEAQRIPKGNEDVRVMVRYPKEERNNVDHLSDVRIRTMDQREIPLDAVANVDYVPGYSHIKREDRKRSVKVRAYVKDGVGVPDEIVQSIFKEHYPEWRKQYPGLRLSVSEGMKEEQEFMVSILVNFFVASLVVLALMAIAFKSYWQPFLIFTAVPFGFMGAIAGHMILGREISMMSFLGFFACSGVVVNDNLVLLDRINQLRAQGESVYDAVVNAGRDRFRAIILTSVTTFVGLVPILFETSTQAQFLVPMVISLSFGVLLATTVTLILVPSLFMLAERAKARWRSEASPLPRAV